MVSVPIFESKKGLCEKDMSIIQMPIEMPVADIQRRLNEEIPNGKVIYQSRKFKAGKRNKRMHHYAEVWKDGDFELELKDDSLYAKIPLKVKVSLKYGKNKRKLQLRKPLTTEAKILVKARTKVGINSSWQLITNIEVVDYEWVTQPLAKVLGIMVNVRPIASFNISKLLPNLLPKLDSLAQFKIDVQQPVRKVWLALQQPQQIAKHPKAWFKANPQNIYVSRLRARNDTLYLSVGVGVFAETVIAEQPEYKVNLQMPNLQVIDSMEKNFEIRLVSTISYQHANDLLAEQLVGYTQSFWGGLFQVKVDDVKVYPSGEKLVAKVQLNGTAKGILYFEGIPVYDPKKQQLYVKDFDFDMKTKNMLVSTANWLNHYGFKRNIQKRLKLYLGDKIAETQTKVEGLLHKRNIGKNVRLDGVLYNLEPSSIELTPNFIKAVVSAKGNAEIEVASLQ